MNENLDIIGGLQSLMGAVPELFQPVLVLLAGAIPFIDGEAAGPLGVWAGLHPVVAGLAAAVGNFACIVGIVLLGDRLRRSVRARHGRTAEPATAEAPAEESKSRRRFRRFLVRFGVPGASILGPLALPGHFTSAILVGSGVRRSWILLWQAVSIVLWTGATTAVATGVLTVLQR
jgi:hypothetical protein